MPDYSVGIYDSGPLWALKMQTRSRLQTPVVDDTMNEQEMTHYAIRHKLRNAFGIMDEETIKQTVSYAAENWRLELIDLSAFSHVADPAYRNRSVKACPIILRLDDDPSGKACYDILDGRYRIAMAKARGDRSIFAWVGRP